MKFDSKKELKKLNKIIRDIPEDKKELVEGLIADASFMAEQLEHLREYIMKNGWSEEYQNGANQKGKKQSVEADAYIKLQKSYQSIIKQLSEFLPDSKSDGIAKAGENLARLVVGGKPVELR